MTGTSKSRFLAQSRRLRAGSPHGFPLDSILRNMPPSSLGKADSMSTCWRRTSTTWSTCSISTGHWSTQAPQVVQAHRTSAGMTSPARGAGRVATPVSVGAALAASSAPSTSPVCAVPGSRPRFVSRASPSCMPSALPTSPPEVGREATISSVTSSGSTPRAFAARR